MQQCTADGRAGAAAPTERGCHEHGPRRGAETKNDEIMMRLGKANDALDEEEAGTNQQPV
jgi:hypothetical protein